MQYNLNNISDFRDTEFKDESPLKTVEKIKDILSNHGIETVEHWLDSTVPYCFSLRLRVVGTAFGTNGKGITKEFALASAYGELMERLQLGYIASDSLQKDGNYSVNDAQSVVVSAKSLLEQNYKWYESLSDSLERFTGEKESPENILMQYADEEGNLFATPYYCINTSKREYIPTALRKAVYTANGCAAGNTMEEALVQAISEVVERYHHIYMFFNNITTPDVPEEVIKECKVAYEIISFLRNNGFKVIVKDCSLGTKFPVICVCTIDTKTGKYRSNYGASPIFEIALERAITEIFQGRDIHTLATMDDLRYDDPNNLNLHVLLNGLVLSSSESFPNFFVGEPDFEYNDKMGFEGENNKDLLKECIEFFKEKNLDLLVRDCSCFGFPTYQVIVPGYSEVFAHRLSKKHNDLSNKVSAKNVLRRPAEATLDEILGFLLHVAKRTKLSLSYKLFTSFAFSAALSINCPTQLDSYMMAATLACINYSMKRYSETIKYVNKMLSSQSNPKEEYLICIKRYLSLLISKYDEAKIKEILLVFHKEDTVNKLYNDLDNGLNIFSDFVLHCDGVNCQNCILKEYCCEKRVREIALLINTQTKQLDFDNFAENLRKLV